MSNLNPKELKKNNEITEPIYFENESNVDVLNQKWKDILNCMNDNDFWEVAESFLNEFDRDYSSWDDTCKSELCKRCDLRSETYPELDRKSVFSLSLLFEQASKEYETDSQAARDKILSISYLVYILSLPTFNRELFIDNNLSISIISLAQFIIDSEDKTDQDILLLFYLFKSLNSIISSITHTSKPSYNKLSLLTMFLKAIKVFKLRSFSRKDYAVCIAMLEALSSSLRIRSHAIKMKDIKILDHILSFIGWPDEVSPSHWEFDDASCKFILQMRFLNVLSSSFQIKSNIQRWFTRGGFMRIIDFIFFTACAFPTQEAPIELLSQTEMNIDPPSWKTIITPGCWIICNHNLKHLFDILTTMCLNSLTSTKKVLGSIRAKKEPTFLISSIVSLIMGMYSNTTRDSANNIRARKFIKELPEVQLNTISFISNLVEHFQYDQLEFIKPLLTIFIENDEYFLRTLWDNAEDVDKDDKNKVVSSYLKATLGSYVFQFLEFISVTTENVKQAEYILQLVHTYIDSGPPYILARATASILAVSIFNTELASKCVISYGYTELIRMIVNLTERLQTETDEEVKKLVIHGRSNLIKTAINVSETKLGHECILKDYTTFEEIFSFLPNFDIDGVKSLAIPLLTKQMVKYDSSDHIENYKRLYSRYADVIVKTKSKSFKFTQLLVEGVIKILSTHESEEGDYNSKVKERQILFSQYNIFSKLISLLDECQPNDPDVKDLCISIIRCLTSLFKHNNQNKEYFRNTIGYAKLKDLILHVYNQDLNGNIELIFELVRMMLDGKYPVAKNPLGIRNQSIKELTEQGFVSPEKNITTPNVTNPHIAPILLHLLPYFNKEDRSVILRTFNDLAISSSVNITKFCSVGALEICLDIIQNFREESEMEGIFGLISTLSCNNITVREFRKMLRIFEPFEGDVRSQWTFNLLQSLEEMIEKGVGPRYYFDFDGIQSAFVLPPIPKWSNDGKGFTICTRIKIESFVHPYRQEEYNPRLFSFANDDGVGWELFFSESNLCFRILHPNRTNEIKRFDIKFKEKEWYTIAFCFTLTNRIIGKSADLRLFVYSEEGITFSRETVSKCPSFSNLTQCIIGSCSKVKSNVLEANTFYGQIGEIIFLGDDLQDRVKVYLEAGHKAYGEWSNVFAGLVHAHSIFDYSPMAIDMNAKLEQNATITSSPICYDLSLHCRDAKILDGLDVVHRRHARNNILCFGGGVFIIFPLLLLLDKHKSLKFKEVFKDVINSDDSEIEIRGSDSIKKGQSKWKIAVKMYNSAMESHSLLDQITRILLKAIQSSKELQIQMIEEKAFSVFTYLILKNSPKHLSKNFLTIIMSTLDKPELSDSIKEHIIEYIFWDFNLWIYTDFNVQKFLLTKVLPYSLTTTPNTRKFITVKRLLEYIRTFYWTIASPDVMATDLIVHPVTKHIIAQRPVLEEIGHLRGYTMIVFNELIANGITLEDTKAIMHFLIDCKDPVLSEEMFFKARTILDQPKHGKEFLEHIITIGYEVLLYPLKSKINTIRSQTIYFICILHTYLSPIKLEFPPAGVMLQYLKMHLPDKRIYKVLLNASIESYHRRDSSEKLCLDDQSYIKNAFIIPVALKLALKDKSQDLQVNFLRDFKLLIEFKDQSKRELMTIPYWEMMLLSFLSPSTEYLLTDNESRFEKYKADIVTDIFVSIAHYKIREDKNAVEYFYDLVYWYQASAMKRNISSLDEFFLSFIRKVLDPIHEELEAFYKGETYHYDLLEAIDKKDNITISNIIHVISFVADYIVLSTKSVGDAIMSSLIVRNSGIPLILMEMIRLIENIPAFQCSVDPLPYSGNTFKNGIFRVANGIPLVYKIAFMQIYNHKDVKILQRCIECINNRLSRKAKKEDAYYIAFHVLNSLSFSITFLSQDKKGENEEKIWINKLAIYTLPLVGSLIKNFKPQFAELKGFDTDYLEYLQELSNSASPDLLITQPRYLENLLLIFQNRLTDIHKIDKESVLIDKLIKKNSKALYSKYMNHCSMEKELKVKALDRIDHILMNFSSDYREVSSIYFKEYYSKVARRWRNIARTLTGERGPWANQHSITHWKLDKVENHLRMRMKLVQNHNFNSHEDALKQKSTNQKREELLNQINLDDVNLEITSYPNELNESGRPYLREEMLEIDLPNTSFEEEERNDHSKTILIVDCDLIQPLKVTKGFLEITTKHLHFKEVRNEEDHEFTEPLKEKIWLIDQLKYIYLRRYLLKRSALEIFLTNQTSYFLNFKKIDDKRKVYDKIKGLNPPNLEKEYTKEECLQLWMKRKISNFEYLMCLNTLAGRTYNDLSQYPVFPWVIMDMESETLDLNDPKIYRDFSKPIGALNPERLKQYIERFESLPETKRFHYGSHYSSAATVLFYLVRVEPFTSLFIKLHDNSFDHPDRMFFSIPQTLQNCLQSTGDVKELIPEFFYFPEMLENSNRFNFGKRQSGIITDHVDLPPWAKTPEEFMHIHRLALESEYVSNNLHKWIDLIFGYKQRGKEALKAYNLFHYFSYEGTVDIDKITDPIQREAVETMICEFGQTPIQLFFEPHAQRGSIPAPETIQPLQPKSQKVGSDSIIWISVSSKKGNIIYLDISGKLYMSNKSDFIETNITTKTKGEPYIFIDEPRLVFPHFGYLHEAFALSRDGQLLFAPRLEVSGIKCINLESRKRHQNLSIHNDLVTSMGLTEDGSILITGSRDTTLLVWKIENRQGVTFVNENSIAKLYGHDDAIACIAVSSKIGICVSVSKGDTCIIHNLKDYSYVRVINHDQSLGKIERIALSIQGYIIFLTTPNRLNLYSINGKYLKTIVASEMPTCMVVSSDGEYLITGGKDSIIIRAVYDFKLVRRIYVDSTVISINLDEKHIVAGLDDGRILLTGFNLV